MDKRRIEFHYLTEENLKKMEQEQSNALMLLGIIGVIMLLSAVA